MTRSPTLAGTSAVAVPNLQGVAAGARGGAEQYEWAVVVIDCSVSAEWHLGAAGRRRCAGKQPRPTPQPTHPPTHPRTHPPECALLPRGRLHQQGVHCSHARLLQQAQPPRSRQQQVLVCRQAVAGSGGQWREGTASIDGWVAGATARTHHSTHRKQQHMPINAAAPDVQLVETALSAPTHPPTHPPTCDK